MATADSFRKAIEVATVLDGGSISGSKCGSIANGAAALSNPIEAQKNPDFPREIEVLMGAEVVQMDGKMGDEGLEPPTFSV
jgi:hypothetical protein